MNLIPKKEEEGGSELRMDHGALSRPDSRRCSNEKKVGERKNLSGALFCIVDFNIGNLCQKYYGTFSRIVMLLLVR